MFQSLLAAGIAAAIVWWLLRRQSTATTSQDGASATEIERLRATVEELSTALEQRAEAVERKLSATIEEARTVHGLLDRTLSAVGAQIVGEPALPQPLSPSQTLETPTTGDESAFAETGIPAFLAKAESLPDRPDVEPIEDAGAYDKSSTEALNELPDDASPDEAPANGHGADGEERVVALIESGVRDSVDIARQTGLTRGEVELIMILHSRAQVDGGPELSTSTSPSVDDRYSAIYALIASGVTDPVEIARKTGLGRGEVELHMGLHARNVL